MDKRTNLKKCLVIAVFLLGMAPAIAVGGTIYVDPCATGGNDGSSWADAYNYLQDALAGGVAGDEIRVADGTYEPDASTANPGGTGNRAATFQLKNGVAIYGGYAGVGEPDPNAQDVELYESILSGDLNGDDEPNFVNNGENSYTVVTGSGTNATAVLDGFTITAGNANGASNPDTRGGGMYNNFGRPTLSNCTFGRNSAEYYGGGMYNRESSPMLTNCRFSGNTTSTGGDGGGMFNWIDSSPMLINCAFSGNSAEEGGGMRNVNNSNPTLTNCTFSDNRADLDGGGMYNNIESSPTLINCTFSGNSAYYDGGGMYNEDSNPTINGCTFSDNSVEQHNGGGVYNLSSDPCLSNCTFSGNSSDTQVGGGMYNRSSSPTLTNCIFFANWVPVDGAGMYNHDASSPKLTNCTFSGNSAGSDGGGIYNSDSNSTLSNCTFSGNSAEYYGGGIWNGGTSSLILANSILWGNTANSGAQIHNSGMSSSNVSYSDVEGGSSGTGNIDENPLFVDAGGPDGIVGTEDDNLRLSGGSLCIDAGDNNSVAADTVDLDGDGNTTEPTPFDLDGDQRFFDDPNVSDTGFGDPPLVDMGAYERNIPSGGGVCGDAYHPYPGSDVNQDCIVNFIDFATFVQQWLECTKPDCD